MTFDHGGDGGNQHGNGDVSRMTSTLATLGTQDIDIVREALGDVLGVADHIHVQHAAGVDARHGISWWDTNG